MLVTYFWCVAKVALPSETQRMGLLGCKYDGVYRIWVPRIGVRKNRDVVFYEGMAPALPDDKRGDGASRVQVAPQPQPAFGTYPFAHSYTHLEGNTGE